MTKGGRLKAVGDHKVERVRVMKREEMPVS